MSLKKRLVSHKILQEQHNEADECYQFQTIEPENMESKKKLRCLVYCFIYAEISKSCDN